MALSIKAAEADEMARSLAKLTGESMTEAVTVALRERLLRERMRHEASDSLETRLTAFARRIRPAYDPRPVSREEWNTASGDDG